MSLITVTQQNYINILYACNVCTTHSEAWHTTNFHITENETESKTSTLFIYAVRFYAESVMTSAFTITELENSWQRHLHRTIHEEGREKDGAAADDCLWPMAVIHVING